MALSEATVRVRLEVTKFENDLRQAVTRAAQKAGSDADKELTKGFSSAARSASKEFRQIAASEAAKSGRQVSSAFSAGFLADLKTLPTRASSVIGKDFAASLGQQIGIGSRQAGSQVSQMEDTASQAATNAGRNAGSRFSRGFLASFISNNPLAAIGAALAGTIATDFAPALSIIAGLPPLLFATGTAVGVLITAFKGVGEAFKAVADGDIKKIEESMAGLGPATQRVVREFATLHPQLAALRKDVGDAFFAQLANQVTALGKAFSGPLRQGVLGISTQLGGVARGITDVFSSTKGVTNLDAVFKGTADFFGQLRPGLRNLTDGFLRFSAAAAPGLNSIGAALTDLFNRMGQFLTRTANSGQALNWVEEGIAGLKSLTETLGDLLDSLLTIASAARPLAFAFSGIVEAANGLISVFGDLPGVLQTSILAAILLSRSGLPEFLTKNANAATLQNAVFTRMAASYQAASAAVTQFGQRQTLLIAGSAAIVGHSQGVVNAITNTGGALTKVASVASGAGAAIATGLGGAFRGIIGVLGGPWGLALTAAAGALAIFSQRQQEAARAAAEYKSQVREIQGTLNQVTGAVTSASTSFAAQDERVRRAAEAFAKFNISSSDVVQGALNQADAHSRVENILRNQVDSIVAVTKADKDLDGVLSATGLSVGELSTALLGGQKEFDALNSAVTRLQLNGDPTSAAIAGTILGLINQTGELRNARQGWAEFSNQTKQASIEQRKIAASIPPAVREANKLAEALGVLADNTANATSKASAFQRLMDQLAGKTLAVEEAQANWNETLQKVNDQIKEGIDAQQGYGAALLDSDGRISSQTKNGLALFRTYQDLTRGLSETNGALLAQGQATGNVSGALQQIAINTAQARQRFIEAANSMGIQGQAAEDLANKMGLIPRDVILKLIAPAYETVKLQLEDVAKKVADIPPGKTVNVGVISEEAKKRLEEVGFQTKTLPNGQVEVTAKTEGAKQNLSSLLSNWDNRLLTWAVQIIGGGKAMGDIVTNAIGNIYAFANGGRFSPRSMPANRAEVVPPNTWRIIGDRAHGDEAFIPLNNSPRSQSILAEAARRMGFSLLANGGLLGADRTSGGVNIASGAIVVNAPFADPELVAKRTVNELARAAAS